MKRCRSCGAEILPTFVYCKACIEIASERRRYRTPRLAPRARQGKLSSAITKMFLKRRKGEMEMQAFNVWLNGKCIDTVFYSDGFSVTVEEVKKSLINHDGYDPRIEVKKERKRRKHA